MGANKEEEEMEANNCLDVSSSGHCYFRDLPVLIGYISDKYYSLSVSVISFITRIISVTLLKSKELHII